MIKKCFLTGEYVFYATDRAKRPHSYKKYDIKTTPAEYCPFCPENEYMTPKRIYSSEDNEIRIVANKYPFIPSGDEHYGIHDVLIDTSSHTEKLCQFSDEHMTQLVQTIKRRMIELEQDERIEYVQVFKNQGIDAGASQSHSHWQIAALSVVPPQIESKNKILTDYYNSNNACYFCNQNFDELLIEENEDFVVYTPEDARFAYEMDILPKRHIQSLTQMTGKEIESLGHMLKNAVRRLNVLYPGICYNVCFFSSPKKEKENKALHFYALIIPRIGQMAGFEFSTGCYINSVLPHSSVKALKEINL